jgi:RNA polymerase sigma factor (sigma-70 family)
VYFVKNPDDGTDEQLIARCRAGDVSAFETLAIRYQVVLFKVALRMLGNREEARDATQSTLLKVYENLAAFDSSRRFFSWAYRILMNDCLNTLRSRRPEEPVSPDLLSIDAPGDRVEAQERRRAIQVALLALPIEQREVVVLRHFAELSYEEMSVTLGIPAKTVKSRLHTARGRLMQLLIGCGGGCGVES